MKRTFKLICKILSYFIFWTMSVTLVRGLIELDVIKASAAMLIHFPIGVSLGWISLLGKSNKYKLYIILNDIFAITIISGLSSILGYLITINIYLPLTSNLIYGIAFVLVGILGSTITEKMKLKEKVQDEMVL